MGVAYGYLSYDFMMGGFLLIVSLQTTACAVLLMAFNFGAILEVAGDAAIFINPHHGKERRYAIYKVLLD